MSKAFTRKILCTVLLAGCSSNGPLDPSEMYEGRFEMVELNGQWLPLVESSEDDCHVIYLGGWIQLNLDGFFRMEYDRTSKLCDGEFQGGQRYSGRSGTYSITGSQIRLDGYGGGPSLMGIYFPHKKTGNTVRIGSIEIEMESRRYMFWDVKSRL